MMDIPDAPLLPPAIEHRSDVVRSDAGEIKQVHDHLIYRSGDPATAQDRACLDEPGRVLLLTSGTVADPVLGYSSEGYARIHQLGSSGYVTAWPA